MADLEKSVAIIFEGVDQMGAGVDSATRKIGSVAGSVEKATAPLADFTKDMLALEAAVLSSGAAFALFAVKVAGDFDKSLREISTLIELPADSLDRLRTQVLDYTSTSTQSIETVTGAYYNLISAGNDTEEAMRLLAAAEQLAVGGKTDLDTAAKALAGTLSAYGAEASEAEDYTDALFVAMQGGMTTIGELSSALPQVTGLASQLGIDFDTLAAAVAALTRTGLSTSQAVTQVGAALNSILGPSQQAKTLAEELGVEFGATALRSQGLEGFLDSLATATGGSEEAMRTLFGSTEATRGVLALTGPVAEAFAEILGDMDDKAGATATAYDKMADAVDLGTQRIKNAMTVAMVAIGDPLLDEFTGIQSAIAEIFNAIGASVTGGQLSGFVDQLEKMFQGIENTLGDVAANLPAALEQADFSSFFDGLEMIREAVADLFDGADLTSVDGLARVIETLGLAFETLSAYTAGAITALGPFLEQVASLANWILKINPELIAWAGYLGGAAIAVNTLLGVVLKLNQGFSLLAGSAGVLPKVAPLFKGIVAALTGPVGITAAVVLSLPHLERLAAGMLGVETRAERLERIRLSPGGEEAQRWKDYQEAIDGASLEEFIEIAEEYGYADDAMRKSVAESMKLVEHYQNVLKGTPDPIYNWGNALDIVNVSTEESIANTRELAEETFDLAKRQDDAMRQLFEDRGQDPWSNLRDAYLDYRDAFVRGEIDAQEWAAIQEAYQVRLVEATGKAAKSQQELAGEVLTTEEAILKARDAVLSHELAMEQLFSNERIRTLELSVDLQTAQIEAEMRKAEAAFDSINTTIQSTEELLGGLFDLRFGGDLGRWDQLQLDKQIEAERKARDEAFELQKKQIEAQIEMMKARTDALRNGDGLIKIESDGLEPALEMVMWHIIEKVQLRANAEGAEFLLGLPGGAS
ncbi:phage tail tape measure protein [Halomonas sp. Y3]|uniref:phage tail tape measure protein n=1 Tax=Halomonas sp. Y3 TaxID=2956797 RepID=UPI0020A0A7E8|nr:phage tail tape measure protein [Halomonas sp. Y3]